MSDGPAPAPRYLGGYRELDHGNPGGPSLRDAVRDRPGPDEAGLVRYLRAGAVLAAATSDVYDVLAPGHERIDGLRVLTDGAWCWYSDLAHYVERYHVALDEEFVRRAREHGWTPPVPTEDDLRRLEEGPPEDADEDA
ncbi:hypothetical protein ACIQUQ_19250 [Streptomyces sp. NPDC101118]|uniref:hypothetical protein n=1 Tax=Streptomyces sp. NPDC101118 TaxID=3366109 RepID=UPI0038148446